MSDEVTPRTKENPIVRKRVLSDCIDHGDIVCPRCGWFCTHLVMPHFDSPWLAHGGFCGQCCNEAATYYDKNGWPPPTIAEEGVG